MTILLAMLLLAAPLSAAPTAPQTVQNIAPAQTSIDALNLTLNSLTSGKPIITGTPNYQNGLTFSNTSGNAITFDDGTVLNSTNNLLIVAAPTSTSGTTITIGAHPTCTGISCVQASTSPVNQTTLTFAGLDANARYRVEISSWAQVATANGALQMQFNGDSTSGHYAWSDHNQSGGGSGDNQSSSASFCPLYFGNDTVGREAVGQGGMVSIDFKTFAGGTGGNQSSFVSPHYDNDNNRSAFDAGFCGFTPTGPITSITIFDLRGSFAATIALIRIN